MPGSKFSRADMLPSMLISLVGRGGFEGRVADGFTSADFQPNDGAVNAISMQGSSEECVSDDDFPGELHDSQGGCKD